MPAQGHPDLEAVYEAVSGRSMTNAVIAPSTLAACQWPCPHPASQSGVGRDKGAFCAPRGQRLGGADRVSGAGEPAPPPQPWVQQMTGCTQGGPLAAKDYSFLKREGIQAHKEPEVGAGTYGEALPSALPAWCPNTRPPAPTYRAQGPSLNSPCAGP